MTGARVLKKTVALELVGVRVRPDWKASDLGC